MKATDANIQKAAGLVAAGNSVAATARALGVAETTIRRWMRDLRWAGAYEAARRAHVVEASNEALLVLRTLLRSGDEKVRVNAAKTLASVQASKDQLAARQAAKCDAASSLAELGLPEDVTPEELRETIRVLRAERLWATEQWEQIGELALANFEEWIERDPRKACEYLREWHQALMGEIRSTKPEIRNENKQDETQIPTG